MKKNREIRFRAWDGDIQEFWYVTLHPTSISWACPTVVEQELMKDFDNNISGVSFKNIEGFQQFTGLRDRNGKEIYDGDIVRLYAQDNGADFGAELRRGTFEVRANMVSGLHPKVVRISKNREVIGNIYENPELLQTNEE